MPPTATYSIADKTAIKALTADNRSDGYSRLCRANSTWYIFRSASTTTADDDNVLLPNDNPSTGRWHKTNASYDFAGSIICNSACVVGGKAFEFYAAQKTLELVVQPSFDIAIASGNNSIEIHRWSQEPNESLNGREFAAELPDTGGRATISIDSTYRWISVFAKNPASGDAFDGVCFLRDGNTLTLMNYA
jgi:hypothetical protein